LISQRLSPVRARAMLTCPCTNTCSAFFAVPGCRSLSGFAINRNHLRPKRSTNVPTSGSTAQKLSGNALKHPSKRHRHRDAVGQAKTPTRLACLAIGSMSSHPCAPAMTAKMLIIKMSVSRWARVRSTRGSLISLK